MKKILSAVAMLVACTAMFAQKATLTGKFKTFDATKTHVSLMDASNLTAAPTPVEVAKDGSFSWDIDVKTPTRYYIVLDDPHTGALFYVEPGMKADMQISYRDVVENNQERTVCDVEYSGDCKDCYEFIQNNDFYRAQAEVINAHYGKNDINFNDFRAEMRYTIDKAEALFSKIGTTAFRKYMKEDYEKKYTAGLAWFMECSNKTDSIFDTYMATVNHDDPADVQSAASYGEYVRKFLAPKGEDGVLYLLQNIKLYYTDPVVINAVATENIMGAMKKAPDNLEQLYKAYIAAVGTPAPTVEQAYNKYKNFMPGAPGVDFTMTDVKGKKVKFSQLKGKAVYFDMWATWCGPCCAEIPYMEKLAAHYKDDKRIQIISVSLDEKKASWEKKIAKDKPEWPQYIMPDNFKSNLCTSYEINGIPRFMMFDKNGNIITINAPRPSSSDIIDWIESKLK